MDLINKVRWRVEKYICDPIVRFYLEKRILDKNFTTSGDRIYKVTTNQLSGIPIKYSFQDVMSSLGADNAFEQDFEKAFLRGMQNEPCYDKDLVRYRAYVGAIIAKMALKYSGDFCMVGVSWGILPRTVFNYCDLGNTQKKYYLMDKWDKSITSEDHNARDNYCGDFDWIKNEFKERNFKIIREFAPIGCNKIDSQISYLHLNTADFNAEVKTLNIMWDKITTPGFIVIDNYSLSKDAFDNFFKEKDIKVFSFLNRQGLVIKS